uniref:IS110 family transposase n=1 Tax=Thaumasiovibrio occultus TaxID=1891184 RepID=UPI000D3D1AE9
MSQLLCFCGVDLAKHHFTLHAVDANGKVILHKAVSRAKLLATVAQLPTSRIGIEACSGSHHWARQFNKLGHDARIIAAKYVTPYRTKGKNDLNDAVAICEAVQRPNTRFIPIKSPERQAILAIHRMREHWVRERTALINRLRAM